MLAPEPQTIDVGDGAARRRIAYLYRDGSKPGVVWLQGLKSDMVSTKASALDQWAAGQGRALLRFDYSGHGSSQRPFEDCTMSDWLEETEAAFRRLTTGPQVVIGSSMGGWLALLLLRRLMATATAEAARIKALLLIAPAWDMTEALMWQAFPDAIKQELRDTGLWLRPSQYGDAYPIAMRLIEDGRRHLLGDEPWDPGRPVHIIHGEQDPDVPFAHSLELQRRLAGNRVRLTSVPDGEHRLSRPQDIALLLKTLDHLVL